MISNGDIIYDDIMELEWMFYYFWWYFRDHFASNAKMNAGNPVFLWLSKDVKGTASKAAKTCCTCDVSRNPRVFLCCFHLFPETLCVWAHRQRDHDVGHQLVGINGALVALFPGKNDTCIAQPQTSWGMNTGVKPLNLTEWRGLQAPDADTAKTTVCCRT